jgi:hypothetical protein
MKHIRGKKKMHTGFWWENMGEGDHYGGLVVDWRLYVLKEWNGRSRTPLIWPTTDRNGRLVYTFAFRTMQEISRLADRLLVSHEGPLSN